jgi:hypothetical protein
VVPPTTPAGVGGVVQPKTGARIQSVEPPDEPEITTVKPDVNQSGTRVIPKVPTNLAAKILEEAKHEVELEIEPSGPASFKSIVGKK